MPRKIDNINTKTINEFKDLLTLKTELYRKLKSGKKPTAYKKLMTRDETVKIYKEAKSGKKFTGKTLKDTLDTVKKYGNADMVVEHNKRVDKRKKNANLTFIGGLVIGFILGLFAGAVFISNVMLN